MATNPPGTPCSTYARYLSLCKAGKKINYQGRAKTPARPVQQHVRPPGGVPGTPSRVEVGVPVADVTTGLPGVIAVLAALMEREHSGSGPAAVLARQRSWPGKPQRRTDDAPGLVILLRPEAPVAQGIEQRPPEPCAHVRIVSGALLEA